MKALLLVAHGSRRAASNQEVEALACQISGELAGSIPIVESAFLELAEPDIPTGIARCIERGATSITVVPYFLAAGTHVVGDIPQILNEARQNHPAVSFSLGKHIGASSLMPALIKQSAEVA